MTHGLDSNSLHITRDKAGPLIQFNSARGFEWNRLELSVEGLHPALDGLRIVHLADFHCRANWDAAYDDLLARLHAKPPDLILFTGDFVESKSDARPALPVVRRLFAAMESRLGTYAILGNHDNELVWPPLTKCNITFIDHRRLILADGEAGVELIGLPGVDRFDLDSRWVASLGKKRPGMLRVVLGHFPNLLQKTAGHLEPDLYLTGHTHGGQVALPNGLPIFRHDTLPRRLCTGIHGAFGTVMVVNRGFGFSSRLALRMFCPAEVVEIVVKRG